MKTQITKQNLIALVERINKLTNSPLETYTKTADGKFVANIGNYHLSWAYGGVELNRLMNSGGGVTCPLGYGHGTKRELWDKMQAFLAGLEQSKQTN